MRRLTEQATVQFDSGERLEMDGLFTLNRTRPASPIAQRLGCALEEGPSSVYVRTDALQATTVPRVFACGDLARASGNVALAVGDGALAGASAHRAMLFGTDWRRRPLSRRTSAQAPSPGWGRAPAGTSRRTAPA